MRLFRFAFSLIALGSLGVSSVSHAAFDYGRTCPTVQSALERIALERKDAAAEALKTGKVTTLNMPVPVPGNYQGYWSLPNCNEPDVTTIYTKYFSYSLIFGAEACLQKVRSIAEGSDFMEIRVPSDNLIKQMEEGEKSFEVGFTVEDKPADLEKSWSENVNPKTPVFKFNYCSTAPDPEHYKLHAPGLKLIRYMDHAVDICDQRSDLAFKDNSDCHHLLYVMSDGNVDFELTAEEIKKALLMLNYLAFINHNGAAIDNLIGSMEKAEERAKKLAELAIKTLDTDGNGTLKRVEITDNYKKLPNNSPEWFYFKKQFKSLANMFPSFDPEYVKEEKE